MIIRSLLIIPKIEKKYFDRDIEYLTKSLILTKKQLLIIKEVLKKQSVLESLLIKEYIKKNLTIDSNLKSAKVVFFWLDPKVDKQSNEVLFEENKNKIKTKYNISKTSTKNVIPTGHLTVKNIFDSLDKMPIEHNFNGKTLITWSIDLSTNLNNLQEYFILTYTINKKELLEKNKMEILHLLPETLLAILISFLLLFFLFKRILKNINTLTKTAININAGLTHSRSNIKGEDDIGILGESFDKMIDSFENNIKLLDIKVEEKTSLLQKSLDEKEILLKEIHHRVKNNLTLTISLLELQEAEITDENTKKVLVDIQERIYTMELLHRKLYESTNLDKIEFKNYVTDLVNAIASSYDRENKVSVIIEMEEIELTIQTAMPYGLVLNELITNAFKYAFRSNKTDQLYIKVQKKENVIILIIKDSGGGLNEDFATICHKTLGLKLINMIIKHQLFGTIEYSYNNGACFTIQAPMKDTDASLSNEKPTNLLD